MDEKHKPATLDITEMLNLNPNTTIYQPQTPILPYHH